MNHIKNVIFPKFMNFFRFMFFKNHYFLKFSKNQIHIFEVKCKPEAITKKQRARLMQSLEFIASVFECSGQVHVIKKLPNDAPFLNLNI